jgi:hypothetical protein
LGIVVERVFILLREQFTTWEVLKMRWTVLVGVVLLLTGCSGSDSQEIAQLKAENETLKKQVEVLTHELAEYQSGNRISEGMSNLTDRAREAAVQANMYTLQLAIEDYAVEYLGNYPSHFYSLKDLLPERFENPYIGVPYMPGRPGDSLYEALPMAGTVYYEHPKYGYSPYTIYGCGKDGKVLSLKLFGGTQ